MGVVYYAWGRVMADSIAWSCPFCGRFQYPTEDTRIVNTFNVDVGKSTLGEVVAYTFATRCINLGCNELTISFSLRERPGKVLHPGSPAKQVKYWSLLPESNSKPQPDYIPAALRTDYAEACAVRDLSPKASATLARRCIQGMIRDFCGISRGTLDAEIKALKALVDEGKAPRGVNHETIEAIDVVRKIGNIGAHMERDIDHIIEVDEGEARALIRMIEMLFEDWYVARYNRNAQLEQMKALGAAKEQQKLTKPSKQLQIEVAALPSDADSTPTVSDS